SRRNASIRSMFAAYSGHLAVKALSAASSSTLTPINFADPQAQANSGIEILDESATREGRSPLTRRGSASAGKSKHFLAKKFGAKRSKITGVWKTRAWTKMLAATE